MEAPELTDEQYPVVFYKNGQKVFQADIPYERGPSFRFYEDFKGFLACLFNWHAPFMEYVPDRLTFNQDRAEIALVMYAGNRNLGSIEDIDFDQVGIEGEDESRRIPRKEFFEAAGIGGSFFNGTGLSIAPV